MNKNMKEPNPFLFDKQNYILMIIGILTIGIGFILMAGGKSDDPNIFNPEEVYSMRRITIAPIVVLLGFLIEIFAIFHKSK